MDDKGAYELARALLQGQDEAACADCLDQLESYVEAQLAGRAYTSLFPEVVGHLDGCVACAEAYGLLFETLAAAAQPAEPPRLPEPDLSFLGASAGSGLGAALRAALADAVKQAADGLRLTLTRPLLDLLAPGPGMAQAVRGADAAALLELTIDGPAAGVAQLQLSVYPADAPEACDLRVQVRLHGRDWPDLAGIAIAVTAAGLRREAVTDAWGEAVIEGVPQAALEGAQIEVRP
jgi:hypothetical protein